MKRLFAITLVMILSSAMFCTVVYAWAGHGTKHFTGHGTKPFNAMWSGTLYVVGPCTDLNWVPPMDAIGDPLQVINVGKGVSTLAGKSDFISSFCTLCTDINLYTVPPSCNALGGSGWAIMTAANGDALHLEITSVTVDLTKAPPEWTEHETIVSGTGRFEGAAGESDSSGTWTLGTDLFPYETEIHPLLLQAPQGWVGATEGEIMY